MLELAADLLVALRAGHSAAVVSVTGVARSAPRGVGASMALTDDARVFGSISGGCIESDAAVLAATVLRDGVARVTRFGYDDETAHAAGLACGGAIDVVAYRVTPHDSAAWAALTRAATDEAVSVLIPVEGRDTGRILSASGPVADLRDNALCADGLVISHAPAARLIVLGATEHAAALTRVASSAGFAVTVCDAWPLLATRERFPHASEVVVADPGSFIEALPHDSIDARTAICVLTHDERTDIAALTAALALPVGFVGALGSRRTVARRERLLREAGVDDVTLARLHSPVGLDLGGIGVTETAVSILAEIIQTRHRGTGEPLRTRTGPLHRRDAAYAEPH